MEALIDPVGKTHLTDCAPVAETEDAPAKEAGGLWPSRFDTGRGHHFYTPVFGGIQWHSGHSL